MNIYSPTEEFFYSVKHPLIRSGKWVALVGLLMLLISLVLWWPMFHADDLIRIKLDAKKRELVYVNQASGLIQQYKIDEEIVPQLENKLKRRITQSQLIGMLNELSKDNNVHILSENYEESQSGSGSIIISDLSISGSYRGIKQFLIGISFLPIWTEIRDVRIENMQGNGTLRGRILIAAYHNG